MLLDIENKLLFTGDMYYPGPLLAMSEDSSFPDYAVSMRKVADRAAEEKIEWIYCSHNYMEKGTDHHVDDINATNPVINLTCKKT